MNRKPSSSQKNSIKLTVNIIVKMYYNVHAQFILIKYKQKKGGGVVKLVQKILKTFGRGKHKLKPWRQHQAVHQRYWTM